jgi:ribosomal protein L37AE/L43A
MVKKINNKYQCPCCGYYTLEEEAPGSFEICHVCGWEDDNVQYYAPNFRGGANEMSLIEAKKNYLEIGAVDVRFLDSVRPPLDSEKQNRFR